MNDFASHFAFIPLNVYCICSEQLTPIERYAMNFLEASLEDICKEELKQAEVINKPESQVILFNFKKLYLKHLFS